MKQTNRGWRAGWRRSVPVALAGLMLSGPGQAQSGRVMLHEMTSPSLLSQALRAETRRVVRELESLAVLDTPKPLPEAQTAPDATQNAAQAETQAETQTQTETNAGTGTGTDTPPDVLYPPPVVTPEETAAAPAETAEAKETKETAEKAQTTEVKETADAKETDTKETDTKETEKKETTPDGADSDETARLREQITSLTVQHDVLAERLAQLQAQMMPGMPAPALNRAPEGDQAQLGYAAGVMYARMIQGLVAEDRLASLTQDERALQAGLADAMAGRPLLMTPEALDRALAQVKAAAKQARTPAPAVEREKEQAWVAAFRQEPGAKKDESGYDYRVTHEGDGAWLTDEDVVDVVVEETLTDGTVVSDMDATGSQVRQPVKAFPPVFSSALKKLRNHGQITLVVPPALAYGERGYPPVVPPGATVVYRVRVQDVTVKQTAKPAKTDAKAKAKPAANTASVAPKPQAKTTPAEKKPATQKTKKTQEPR